MRVQANETGELGVGTCVGGAELVVEVELELDFDAVAFVNATGYREGGHGVVNI